MRWFTFGPERVAPLAFPAALAAMGDFLPF